MAFVVMFHSGLGLRPSVRRFADVLRADGHEVVTPDLFGGAVFDDLTAGTAARDAIGVPELVRRAGRAVEQLPHEVVYAGFSMGAMPALLLAATRPGARGAVLVQGAAPLAALGVDAWPAGVPVQVHSTRDDPWLDGEAIAGLAAAVPATLWEHHEYAGAGHLVTDEDWQDYEPRVADAVAAAVRRWLPRGADDGRSSKASSMSAPATRPTRRERSA